MSKSWQIVRLSPKKKGQLVLPDGRKLDQDALRKLEKEYAQKDYQFIERMWGLPINKFTDFESYIEAGSKKVWATFRACHITACVLLSTVFKVTSQSKNSQGNVSTEIDLTRLAPDLHRFLHEPNPFDTWEEMLYQWTFHMKLCGNAYWYKDDMNGKDQPRNLYPLLPQLVQPIPDKNEKVAGYIYRVNGREIRFERDEIIHFRRPSPRDNIMGIGDIESAEPLFNDYINRDVFAEKFMENGAQPSGIMIREEEVQDEEEWKKLVNFFRVNYTGKKNAGKTAFLNGKWSYQQLGMTLSDMQNIEATKLSTEYIFLAHGVPLSVAGFSNAANYATARQDDISFRRYECVPLLDILSGKLNGRGGIIKPFNPNWQLDYALSGLIDVEQIVKDYGPLIQMGALTPNELRELCGLARVKDNPLLDQYYLGGGLTPLEMAGLADPSQSDIQKLVGQLGLKR